MYNTGRNHIRLPEDSEVYRLYEESILKHCSLKFNTAAVS